MTAATETGDAVIVRPKRVRRVAIPCAIVVLASCVLAGVLLRNTPTGVIFSVSDQVAMVGIGVVLAGLIMLPMRPRLRADENGVEIRNPILTRRYEWSDVVDVSFPDGAAWARLELPDDEYEAIMAIQAVDGEHAVRAMRDLRSLRRRIGHLD